MPAKLRMQRQACEGGAFLPVGLQAWPKAEVANPGSCASIEHHTIDDGSFTVDHWRGITLRLSAFARNPFVLGLGLSFVQTAENAFLAKAQRRKGNSQPRVLP